MTWNELITAVQEEVGDSGGIFHETASVQRYLFQAELLISMQRVLVEKTETLTFDGRTLYPIHTIFTDFIAPLRIAVDGVTMDPDTIATLSCLDPNWYKTEGNPEVWFMAGATHLGFYRVPISGNAQITYLAVPDTTGTEPTIAETWREALIHYGNAVALSKEAQYPRATDHLEQFMRLVGIERDPRILGEATQKPAKVRSEIIREAND